MDYRLSSLSSIFLLSPPTEKRLGAARHWRETATSARSQDITTRQERIASARALDETSSSARSRRESAKTLGSSVFLD
jgi:hypothetical protein